MMEEEPSEKMFRIILLSNQKKNKSVSCFSCLQTYYTGGCYTMNIIDEVPFDELVSLINSLSD